jgi:hypothetical protein
VRATSFLKVTTSTFGVTFSVVSDPMPVELVVEFCDELPPHAASKPIARHANAVAKSCCLIDRPAGCDCEFDYCSAVQAGATFAKCNSMQSKH